MSKHSEPRQQVAAGKRTIKIKIKNNTNKTHHCDDIWSRAAGFCPWRVKPASTRACSVQNSPIQIKPVLCMPRRPRLRQNLCVRHDKLTVVRYHTFVWARIFRSSIAIKTKITPVSRMGFTIVHTVQWSKLARGDKHARQRVAGWVGPVARETAYEMTSTMASNQQHIMHTQALIRICDNVCRFW